MKLFLMIARTALLSLILSLTFFAADLAGAWKGSMETQGGTTEVTLTFKPGATLSGTFQTSQYEGSIEDAKLDGDKISFAVKIGPGTITFEGIVAGDVMKLDVIGTQGDKYKLVCQRQ